MRVIKEGSAILNTPLDDNEDTESRQELVVQSLALFEIPVTINALVDDVPLRLLWIAEQVPRRNSSTMVPDRFRLQVCRRRADGRAVP